MFVYLCTRSSNLDMFQLMRDISYATTNVTWTMLLRHGPTCNGFPLIFGVYNAFVIIIQIIHTISKTTVFILINIF